MRTAALSVIALLVAGSAGAQFTQYTAPGSLVEEQVPTQERLEAAMEDARYHLGPLRVGPWVALKDVAYTNNVYGTATNPKSDVTATLGAGVHAYLPIGHWTTLGMYVLPEYVWWHDLSNRRGWNGAIGAGLFGYFNRMTVEVQAGASRVQQYASSELEVPVNLEDQRVSALVEVKVLGRLSLFGVAGVDQWRYNERGLTPVVANQLILLDRDEKRAGGGVRYHFTKTISLGIGAGQYTTDFVHPENPQSNSGPALITLLSAKAGHLSLDVNVVTLDLKPTGSSEFVPYRGTNGGFRIGFRPAGKLEMNYYGGRNLVYSLAPGASYYLDERTGVALQYPFGWRASGRVYWEKGQNPYVASATGGPVGTDHFTTYGGNVSVQIGRSASLNVGASRSDYTSEILTRNRSITLIQASLHLQSGKGQWW